MPFFQNTTGDYNNASDFKELEGAKTKLDSSKRELKNKETALHSAQRQLRYAKNIIYSTGALLILLLAKTANLLFLLSLVSLVTDRSPEDMVRDIMKLWEEMKEGPVRKFEELVKKEEGGWKLRRSMDNSNGEVVLVALPNSGNERKEIRSSPHVDLFPRVDMAALSRLVPPPESGYSCRIRLLSQANMISEVDVMKGWI
ncbi:hypothetical protein BDQ12DRAFT_668829 [Crucibulum laeve]|uniref:Uncharacterized protein n=1 Tax=Crucibulum laeve TaxID=68775 RepID=A0A5C3LPT9_9AGAR|nr:hypothetical protein BDQ12DRAFT_668829 [Crucibulum laeve]